METIREVLGKLPGGFCFTAAAALPIPSCFRYPSTTRGGPMAETELDQIVDFHDPLWKRDYLSQQHIERYRFAAAQVLGPRVLDIACGSGYGTAMLHQAGCEAVGADIDEERLKDAQKDWPGPRFTRADVLDLPWEDGSFDTVVSFETLEHVADGQRFMREVRRVLRPGGMLICSTPNIRFTAHPPFHVKEYTPLEFFSLVESTFVHVKRYSQEFRWTDRAADLYAWHFPRRLWLIKSLFAKAGKFLTVPAGAVGEEAPRRPIPGVVVHARRGSGEVGGFYRVRDYGRAHFVRIMVAVATAPAGTDD
jgi:2-polyprenyl-3-methyl-5-hydroxy-6-metoxy-1,4-benzoquinol methylase